MKGMEIVHLFDFRKDIRVLFLECYPRFGFFLPNFFFGAPQTTIQLFNLSHNKVFDIYVLFIKREICFSPISLMVILGGKSEILFLEFEIFSNKLYFL